MAQPLSRSAINKLVDATLKDNNQQYITAARLRSVVNPIVDSTYGMKTIWSGTIDWKATGATSSNNVDYLVITENYADTNWIPDINTPSVSGSYPGRYSIIDGGLNIVADNGTGNGTISNVVTTTTPQAPIANGSKGMGARFDLVITNGVCTGIQTTNPGTGYSFSYIKNSGLIGDYIFPNVNFTSGGRVPTIQFSTRSYFFPWRVDGVYLNSDGSMEYGWNVMVDTLNTTLPVNRIVNGDSSVIQINYTDKTGTNTPKIRIAVPTIPGSFVSASGTNPPSGAPSGSSSYNHYHNPMIAAASYDIIQPSYCTGARSTQTGTWAGAGEDINEYGPGFWFNQWNRLTNIGTSPITFCKADIEIRVPIINSTPVII